MFFDPSTTPDCPEPVPFFDKPKSSGRRSPATRDKLFHLDGLRDRQVAQPIDSLPVYRPSLRACVGLAIFYLVIGLFAALFWAGCMWVGSWGQ